MDDSAVLVAGGSAGGVEAAVELVTGLPPDLPACVLITLLIGAHAHSRLPQILDRAGPLTVEHARDGTVLRPGLILVAPPDRHLLVVDGRARLSSGPRINRHRPAIDALFASAARWAGTGVTAVVLSGMLDDGAVGSVLVSRAGGRVLVQDPAEALFPSMPRAALAAVPGAGSFRACDLGAAARPVPSASVAGKEAHVLEPFHDSDDVGHLAPDETRLTRLACPDCGGGLAEVDLGDITYFRCHVGHQFSPQVLEAAQRETAESKLWAATAALEEHAVLARHLERRAADPPEDYGQVAERSASAAEALRRFLDARTDPLQG